MFNIFFFWLKCFVLRFYFIYTKASWTHKNPKALTYVILKNQQPAGTEVHCVLYSFLCPPQKKIITKFSSDFLQTNRLYSHVTARQWKYLQIQKNRDKHQCQKLMCTWNGTMNVKTANGMKKMCKYPLWIKKEKYMQVLLYTRFLNFWLCFWDECQKIILFVRFFNSLFCKVVTRKSSFTSGCIYKCQ